MEQLRSLNWRFLIQAGLLAGLATFYMSMVGMIELFSKRDVLVEVVSLGQVLTFGPTLIAGYIVTRRFMADVSASQGLVGALLTGLVASALPLLLIIVGSTFDIRDMFVSVTPALVGILSLGRENLASGAPLLIGALAAASLTGGVVAILPDLVRRALINGAIWTLGAGMMSELINQVLQQFLERETQRQILASGTLLPRPGLILFVVVFLATMLWGTQSDRVRGRMARMTGGQQRAFNTTLFVLAGFMLLLIPRYMSVFVNEVLSNVGLYIMMGLGLNIAVGLAGLLDLGYVTNFAVGAYVMSVLTSTGPLGLAATTGIDFLNFWIVLPIAVLCAMFTGFALSLPVLRMRGDYLAIATLGFGEIIRLLALSDWLKPYIGGAQGVLFVPKAVISIPGTSFVFEFAGPQQIYYIILAACLLMLFVSVRLNNSRTGRRWMAMREDEDVAAAMGIDTTITKVIAFTLSAASGGLAGAIFASKLGTIFPHSFNLLISINVLSLIIVGGLGSIPGVVVGALALIGLPELLREFSEYRLLLYGALLIVMMLVRPQGLWPSAITRREMGLEDVQEIVSAPGD